MKKIFLYIFICFSAIFVMSHNTYADVLSVNVRPVWTNYNATWQFYTNRFSCQSGGYCWGADSVNQFDGRADGATIRKIRFSLPNSLNLSAGSYITADFYIRQSAANNANDTLIGPIKSDTSHITLIDTNVAPASNTNYLIHMTFYVEQDLHVTDNSTYITVGSTRGNDYNIIWQFESGNLLTGGVVNTYTAVKNTDYSGALNNINTGITNLNSKLNSSNTKLDNISNSLNELKNKENTSTTNIENQSSSDIGNSEDQKTQSLLGVFSSFATAVMAITPSNCNVDFDLGHIDFGQQNLCSNPVPTAFQVISSIIVLAFTIPFVVHIIRRILGLIREMQT